MTVIAVNFATGKPERPLAARSILVVEDDHALRDELCQFLQGYGMQVNGCSDLAGARSLLRRCDFDIILLDLWLGRESGLDLLREVKSADRTPVIVMTAQDGMAAKVTSAEFGADGCMIKPLVPAELIARLSALLASGNGKAGQT